MNEQQKKRSREKDIPVRQGGSDSSRGSYRHSESKTAQTKQ